MPDDNNFSGTRRTIGRYMKLDLAETDGLAEFEKTDVTEETKKEHVQHLVAQMAGSVDQRFANEFRVTNEEISPLRLTTPEGKTVPYSPDGEVNKTFLDTVPEEAANHFNTLSTPGVIDLPIRKGKSANPGEKNVPPSTIGRAITNRINGTSNFSSDRPFIPQKGAFPEEETNVGSFFIHRELGKHLPDNWLNPTGEQPGVVNVSTLKNIGLLMMMNSTGDYFVPNDPNNIGQQVAAASLAGVPGLARLGARVPVSRFDGTEILEGISDGFRRPSGGSIGLSNQTTVLSNGSFYTQFHPFDGLSSTSARTATTLMSLVVVGLMKAYAFTFKRVFRRPLTSLVTRFGEESRGGMSLVKGENTTFAQHRSSDYGSGEIVPFILKTEAPFEEALSQGFKVFFGDEAGILQGAANALTGRGSVGRSPGFYQTLLREVIRSTQEVLSFGLPSAVSSVLNKVGAGGRMNTDREVVGDQFQLGLPIISVVEASSRLIFDAKITRFINVIAAIGDISLSNNKEGGSSLIDGIIDGSPDDDRKINLASLVSKNRLSTTVRSSTRTAWGSSTTPSKMLLPTPILQGAQRFSNGRFNLPSILAVSHTISGSARLGSEEIREFEDKLDSSYVPFYFHDLRTNEIISFHAFLNDISDELRADYTDDVSYGRMGTILSHKNTTRDISLGFKVVSTNKADFNEMWLKLNKLTMMLFPQYTKGRELQIGNQRFTQPFSQIPSSSPMIRLRVGDLITTNFSDFDLARQFGVTDSRFNPGVDEEEEIIEDLRGAVRTRMEAGVWNPGEQGLVESGTVVSDPEIYAYLNAPGFSQFLVEIIERDKELGTYKVRILPGDKEFLVEGTSIRVDEDYIRSFVTEQQVNDERENRYRGAMQEFFHKENNPIIKSFNSARGQGVAGFITTCRFDNTESTWETSFGSRAPKMLDVSIGFTPVFDINPGLDSNGFMQGALYNVGSTMNAIKSTGAEKPLTSERFNTMIAAARKEIGPSRRRRGY